MRPLRDDGLLELRRAHQALQMLSACNQAILRSDDELALMKEICRVAVKVGGHRMAWVGLKRYVAGKTVEPVAEAGYTAGYLRGIRVTWDEHDVNGKGPTGTAVRTGQPQVFDDFTIDPRFKPWRARASKRGYRSSMAVPITHEGEVLGAISIYSSEAGAFSYGRGRHLVELADDLAIGITSLRARKNLRAVAAELTVAEERERRRIAGVLHDDLQQLLVGAKLALGAALRSKDLSARKAAKSAAGIVDKSIACSRTLTEELSPPSLAGGGLRESLEWLAEEFQERHGLRVSLSVAPDAVLRDPAATLVYRCARELLFNAVKHGAVKAARLEARRAGKEIRIDVIDAGVGFDPGRASRRRRDGGFGLPSIRDRLALIGGRLEIRSENGRGSRLTLWAPI